MRPEDALTISPTSFDRVAVELLLLDATMDDDLSSRIAEWIKDLFPTCKIVLLIAEHAIDRIFEFAQIGSQGYLSEALGLADVRAAIQTVLGGQQYCSPQVANALLFQAGHGDRSREQSRQRDYAQLTSREREILELIAYHQLGNKQIARQLRISVYTVKNHVHNIIDKLGVEDRHEAVRLARRRGLLVSESVLHGDVGAIRVSH